MAQHVQCLTSLVAFFPASIYKSVGPCDILPSLVESVGRDKLRSAQFLWNGATRLTFINESSCDHVLDQGLCFGEHSLRVVAVEQRDRLVYVRDLPVKVRDSAGRAFLGPFGEVLPFWFPGTL